MKLYLGRFLFLFPLLCVGCLEIGGSREPLSNSEESQLELNNNSLVTKLLKSNLTDVTEPVWNLMMKNIYSTGAFPSIFKIFILFSLIIIFHYTYSFLTYFRLYKSEYFSVNE
jgi:hypothetical protein